MILRGDLHLVRKEILDRMIRAVMPEFELKGFAAQREAAYLMPKANPKHRHLADEVAHVLNRVSHRFRISRPVRQEDTVRPHRKDVFGGSHGRHNADLTVMV